MRKIEVPEGYTMWLFASDDETGELVASERVNGKPTEVRRVSDVLVPFPLPGHTAQATESLRFVLTDAEGTKHVYLGSEAADCRAIKLAAEKIRGMVRERTKDGKAFAYSEESVREFAARFTKIAGSERGGVSKKAVENAKRDAETQALNAAHDLLNNAKTVEEFKAVKAQLAARLAALRAT